RRRVRRADVRCARGPLGSRLGGAHERPEVHDIQSMGGSSGSRNGGGVSIVRPAVFATRLRTSGSGTTLDGGTWASPRSSRIAPRGAASGEVRAWASRAVRGPLPRPPLPLPSFPSSLSEALLSPSVSLWVSFPP